MKFVAHRIWNVWPSSIYIVPLSIGQESSTGFPVGTVLLLIIEGNELLIEMIGVPEIVVNGRIGVIDEPLVGRSGDPEAEVNGGMVGPVGRVEFIDNVGKPEL